MLTREDCSNLTDQEYSEYLNLAGAEDAMNAVAMHGACPADKPNCVGYTQAHVDNALQGLETLYYLAEKIG